MQYKTGLDKDIIEQRQTHRILTSFKRDGKATKGKKSKKSKKVKKKDVLMNSSVDQRRLESANLTLCRWISGYDYG